MHRPVHLPRAALGAACAATLLSLAACGGGSSAPAAAPAITAQPASLTVAVGSAAAFTVGTSGSSLSYQWKRNGADIAGATAASYTLPRTVLADTRSKWSVAVTHPGGAMTSSEATLHVTGMEVVAGHPTEYGLVDGAASAARFESPFGLALDKSGKLFVGDYRNDALRKISPAGQVSTVAKNFTYITGLALDSADKVHALDLNTVQKVTPDGVVSTMALFPHCGGRGGTMCVATGAAFDSAGFLIAASTVAIRKIAPDGSYTFLEGTEGISYNFTASPNYRAVVSDGKGKVYIAGSEISVFDSAGKRSFIAGGPSGVALDGAGAAARFGSRIPGAVLDARGNLYVSDMEHHTIRRVSPAGLVTTIVGMTGQEGTEPGPLPGLLNRPQGMAIDAHGDLYVTSGHAIVKIQLPPQ